MTRTAIAIRGLPEWLIRDYLSELGAESTAAGESDPRMVAQGWSVSWTKQEASIPGGTALRLTQFDMAFDGDSSSVEDAVSRFMKKAQRGGG